MKIHTIIKNGVPLAFEAATAAHAENLPSAACGDFHSYLCCQLCGRMKINMAEFCDLWCGGPKFAQAAHFRLSTDCVLLSDFVNTGAARRAIDLGCASGAVMLLLLARTERLHMTGIEILPEAVELARENMAVNAFDGRSALVCGDIRAHRELFKAGSFDLAAANPPYFPVDRGALSPFGGRSSARGESLCTLDDICAAAEWLLRTGGNFCLVHKPERLSEIFCAMVKHGLEPKRLRLVENRAGAKPSLVLVEAKRGGKPGLSIEPPLILTEADGAPTEEYKRIYHIKTTP